MPYNVQPAVIGCAILPSVPGDRESLEELIYRASQSALADAGLTIDDIDGIVVGANDQMDGRAISVMAASGSVGGVDREILSTPSGAEHAFVLGALRVATGQFQTQLVVSWSPTEASPLHEVERLAADPYFHRRLPLDELAAAGLQAGAMEHQVPGARQAALAIAEKNRRNGARAYPALAARSGDLGAVTRWPLREGMVGVPATGAVALVLAWRGMTEAAMSNSLLMIGQGEGQPHGFHSLNGHGAKKAGEHLGRETMYLSKTEAGYAVGRMGASTNELSVSNDLTMTAEFASLGEVSALDRAISSSTTTPSAPTGRSCARCWRASRRQLARWSSSASTTPTRASRWMLPVG